MNELEKLFDKTFSVLFRDSFMKINEVDFPLFAIPKENTRFKPPQIPDRLLLSKKRQFSFELKQNKGKSMRFDRVSSTQRRFLKEFSDKVGKAFILVSFLENSFFFLLEIDLFLNLEKTIKKKSFNIEDIRSFLNDNPEISERNNKSREIYQYIPKRHKTPILDLRFLIMNRRSFLSFT